MTGLDTWSSRLWWFTDWPAKSLEQIVFKDVIFHGFPGWIVPGVAIDCSSFSALKALTVTVFFMPFPSAAGNVTKKWFSFPNGLRKHQACRDVTIWHLNDESIRGMVWNDCSYSAIRNVNVYMSKPLVRKPLARVKWIPHFSGMLVIPERCWWYYHDYRVLL